VINVVKYNLFENPGVFGGHADWVQLSGGQGTNVNYTVDFNTVIQQLAAGSQGFGLFPGTGGNFTSALLECNYNSVITYTSVAQPNYIFSVNLGGPTTGGGTVTSLGTVNCQNNYVDNSGVVANNGSHGFNQFGSGAGGTFTYGPNYDMRTGLTIGVNT
jgi:hypothetical protein